MAKRKKSPLVKLQNSIWILCKNIIRLRYGNSCYTCGVKNLSGNNWQTGHMFGKASLNAYMKYDLRNLRPQCFKCNMRLEGRGAMFYKRMLQDEGHDYVQALFEDTLITLKHGKETKEFYLGLLENYKQIYKEECLKSSTNTKTSKKKSKKR